MSPQSSLNSWESLEAIPGDAATPATWRHHLGPHFDAFRNLCLDSTGQYSEWLACPLQCGCNHHVTPVPSLALPGQPLLAHCTCPRPECPPFPVSLAELLGLQLNPAKLARHLCHALGLASHFDRPPVPFTVQIGTWSADALPVFLTIALWRSQFRAAVAELVARLDSPFLLLAPTSQHLDAHPLELLTRVGAGFFSLEHILTFGPNGALQPTQLPGQLFARFTPQPQEPVSEQDARRLFALAKALDGDATIRKALPSNVLRLYCLKNLEPNQIARECACSRSVVYARLAALACKFGRPPAEFRQFSSHLQAIADSLADPRARRL